MNKDLEYLKFISKKYNCDDICNFVLDEPKISLWSGSSNPHTHHYGEGQLIKHIAEVTELAENISSKYNQVDKFVLITSCIYHDYGKIYDYSQMYADFSHWKITDHKDKIHHITRSVLFFNEKARELNMDNIIIDKITHCILSHHGNKEWGSPVSPQTPEAIILHYADCLSAHLNNIYAK